MEFDGFWRFSSFMKTFFPPLVASGPLLLAVGFCFSNCQPAAKEPSPVPQARSTSTATNASQSLVTAPVDYIAASVEAGQDTKGKMGLIMIRKGVESFQEAEERNPASLGELVEKKYLKVLPRAPTGERFDYNPATGEVKLVPQ